MVKRARSLSLVLQAPASGSVTEAFVGALSGHLVGQTPSKGERLALPGWPTVTIERIEPPGSRIGPGTEVLVHVPPRSQRGPLSVVFLVDGSLTMGGGEEVSRYQKAAGTIEDILLNGRGFLARAGIVVQGGTTRQVDNLTTPEELSGASILKVEPRGTFDMATGLQRSVEMLTSAPSGPWAVLILTDGEEGPSDPLRAAEPALHAGVTVFALVPGGDQAIGELCKHTGGDPVKTPERAFEHLAALAGAEARFSPSEAPVGGAEPEEPYEFEVVIEAMEEPA